MPANDPSAPIQHVQTTNRVAQSLQKACEDAAELDGEVVVAIREFPSSEYTYIYNRHEISIVRARLQMRGYYVDTKTVMDSKCSKLVLVIENDTTHRREVHAEKLK